VILARSTLAEWVGRVGVALQPLVDRLSWYLLQGNTLHADEDTGVTTGTRQRQNQKSLPGGLSQQRPASRAAIIVFDYQPGRSGAHARRFLGDWRGHLLVDDYAGYKALFTPDGHERGLY